MHIEATPEHDDPDGPLRLPDPPAEPARPPIPVLSAVVPVVGAVVLWMLTGSVYALWFAALGPLLAIAALGDAVRGRRRSRRSARRAAEARLDAVAAGIRHRHDEERRARWARHPDVAGFAAHPAEIWRSVPGRQEALVVGRGHADSDVRVEGPAHTARGREVRRSARALAEAPILVPIAAGVAVAGPPVLAAAVVRALALQICLAHPPGDVRVTGSGAPSGLPHLDATRGALLYVGEGGRALPAGVDIPVVRLDDGVPPPPRCAAVLTLLSPSHARLDHGGRSEEIEVEAVSAAQAARVVESLAERARRSLGQRADAATSLADVFSVVPVAGGVLAAPIGVSAGEPVVLDLAEDGPHAVVIGVTGSGKSELLTSWIAGLCRGRTAAEVGFLLVDFKGGRTFDALRVLPHVAGVLTDLDDAAALRAIESLHAEVRHRERTLAAHDVRDVGEAPGILPRLVIVVDEYAALVAAHPALHDLFGDIAARGRALGMHLILASQRAAGAFRDAVLANAPLRIALRVTDAADSRAVLGSDEAAHLSGLALARGTALVKRAADVAPLTVRVARCDPETLAELSAGAAATPRARAPWLPPLPARLPLSEVRRTGEIVLGLVDDPATQRQPLLRLGPDDDAGFAVVGGAGSGKSTLLRAVAAQAAAVTWVAADPEQAWDALAALDALPAGALLVVDDVDAIAGRFPVEYAAEWLGVLERTAREARGRGIRLVLSAARLSGGVGRTADLLPRRALLRLGSRADHVAAGGEANDFLPDLPPGRGRWERSLVQFVDVPAVAVGVPEVPDWMPGERPAGFVAPPGERARAFVARCAAAGVRVRPVEEAGAILETGVLLWGTPEAWLGRWGVLTAVRADGDLVIDAACAAEFRSLTGRRSLPPYALPGADRAWHVRGDGEVTRVRLRPPTRGGSGEHARERGGFASVRGRDTRIHDVPAGHVESRGEGSIGAQRRAPAASRELADVGERRVRQR